MWDRVANGLQERDFGENMTESIVTLSDGQKRLLAATESFRTAENGRKPTIRELAAKYNVPRSTLGRALKKARTAHALLAMANGRGRGTRLTVEEEGMIVEAVREFNRNGTPLDRQSLQDLVQMLVKSFPAVRKSKIAFKNNRPGADWVRLFLQRHPALSLRKRVNLEQDRALAMNPTTVAAHFTRLKAVIEKYDIHDPSRIFNLDESGFSIKGMTLGGRAKCIVSEGARGNIVEPKFRGSCDHVTLMPVVSAAGQALTPVVVLPGKEAKFRRRADRTFETPSDYLPQPNYCFMRPIAGVDGDIFFLGRRISSRRRHIFVSRDVEFF